MMHEDLAGAFSLDGRIAVVTGAASGIGRDTAVVLAQAGAHVVLADVDEAGLARTLALVAQDGGLATIHATDMTARSEVDALADRALALSGSLDVWVNAAGIIVNVPITQTVEADLDRLLAVNLKGVFWGTAAAGRAMTAAGGGSIVNLASAGADMPSPGLAIYSMTKAAVNMLTRTAAAEFGPAGVRVNSVAPGFVDTPMVSFRSLGPDGLQDPALHEQLLQQRAAATPLGLSGTPRDIALAILYLASNASRYVTGQILRPNGGIVMP